jgi:hypothetical protein
MGAGLMRRLVSLRGKGDPGTAANVLDALSHEVAAQTGLAIPSDLAATLNVSLSELIGLQRASSV